MKERPILFSGPMVRAILEGQKTQTRRVIHPQPAFDLPGFPNAWAWNKGRGVWQSGVPLESRCPHGQRGDRLWVRETWAIVSLPPADSPHICRIGAGGIGATWQERWKREHQGNYKWKPSIHMPRWACRIVLEITGIRVQQLQDIDEADALAEGIEGPFEIGYTAYRVPGDSKPRYSSASAAFKALWNSINIIRAPWDRNPWVWAIEFKRVEA